MTNYFEFCKRSLPYVKAPVVGSTAQDIKVENGSFPVQHTLPCGLITHYLVDHGESFQYVVNEFMEKAGLNVSSLNELAIENLVSFAGSNLKTMEVGSLHGLICGGNFEATLLLLDDLWKNTFNGLVKGTYIAAVPARDVLLFGDSSNPAAFKELREMVDRVWAGGDHLISKDLYIYENNVWLQYNV